MRSCGAALVALALAAVPPAGAATRAFAVDPGASSVRVHVGKSGVFAFAGHPHEVAAERFEGRVDADPDDLARSSVELSFEASGLKVSARGEPQGDAPKVQEVMAGPKVLDESRFPTVRFRSRQVSGRPQSDVLSCQWIQRLHSYGLLSASFRPDDQTCVLACTPSWVAARSQ